ncbi:Nucleolar protein of 40 kDa [Mortierella polycephala]|uniref:Nucleolar protein of 40 kDa n=1 Tax=Mortierella polycephala TaxID=41804 RepID=A0A9P6PUG1_9FUNG|nr:Nucleolar protein of 40 kDa [Mortierella polycephala]
MDSQQAAFEKFKTSGDGRKFSRESRNAGDTRSAMDGPMPDLYSIHQGKVARVEDYGAFIQIPGFRKHGLVHKKQASRHYTEKMADVVAEGDQVWIKVISLQDDKISLSMKYVSQGSGEDLDPNLVQLSGEEDKRRVHGGFMDKAPISVEQGGVLLKTVCKKCGAAGHLATECFSGGEQFELLDDNDDGGEEVAQSSHRRSDQRDKEKKKKDRDDRDKEKEVRRRERKEKKASSSHKRERTRDRSRSNIVDLNMRTMMIAKMTGEVASINEGLGLELDPGLDPGLDPDHVRPQGGETIGAEKAKTAVVVVVVVAVAAVER